MTCVCTVRYERVGNVLASTMVADTLAPQLTSRQHGRICRAGGRFMLVGRSANGTYVAPESPGTIYVHREETPLLHAGRIFLGADPAQAAVEPIRYRPVRSRS